MALEVTIRTNGLPLSYHRISQINIETNVRVGIWVRSYLNAKERNDEINGETVYHSDCYYSTEGPEGPSNAEEAYEWLREHYEQFANAKNV